MLIATVGQKNEDWSTSTNFQISSTRMRPANKCHLYTHLCLLFASGGCSALTTTNDRHHGVSSQTTTAIAALFWKVYRQHSAPPSIGSSTKHGRRNDARGNCKGNRLKALPMPSRQTTSQHWGPHRLGEETIISGDLIDSHARAPAKSLLLLHDEETKQRTPESRFHLL
jgi:hypothetical protein